MKLDRKVYEEVEHDERASTQVFYVLGIVSVCQGIGLGLANLILGEPLLTALAGTLLGFITTLIGLFIWSYLVYWVGTRLFRGVATQQETWRTAGFARSPGVFFAIPFIGFLVNIWMIITQVIAAREALDVSTGKAIATCIISFIPYIILLSFIEAALLLIF